MCSFNKTLVQDLKNKTRDYHTGMTKKREAVQMTINQIISLVNINDIPFMPQKGTGREKGKLPIYSTKEGVCYLNEESIWSIGNDQNSQEKTYEIKKILENWSKELGENDIEMDKYVAVFELLLAINEYKSIDDNVELDTVKRYVEIINKEIFDALDFQQVSEMKALKDLIMKDKLYNQMLFKVKEVKSTKNRQFLECRIESKNYLFGNIQYHEKLDIVNIIIYDDVVEIFCAKEGRGSECKLDKRKKYTAEEKIILTLDCWRCSCTN